MLIKLLVCLMTTTAGVGATVDEPPKLECLNDGMRMHFVPDSDRPFTGHIYVKGFFFSKNCHLDYTQHALADPFYFHVPYNTTCQVHREKADSPAGQSFSIILIVQHHPLFITQSDKAFSVSCFYRDHPNEFEQKLEISDITTAQVQDEPSNPSCSYEVLAGGMQGQVVKFASIGDILLHKWTCETEEQGILVHSCFVRDGVGNEFPLLNERGCITDGSLIHQPLTYTSQLNTCYTPINAFKFADQMIVYFSCQITLCNKADNGCEGITPPVCEFQPLPDNDTIALTVVPRIPTTTDVNPGIEKPNALFTQTPSNPSPTLTTLPFKPVATETSHLNENQTKLTSLFNSSPWAASRHARSVRSHDHLRHKRNSSLQDLVTVDVQADQLIIFTKDENPALISMRLNTDKSACYHGQKNGTWVFLFFLFIVCISSALLWTQHRYYSQRLYCLQANAAPFELGCLGTTALNFKNSTPQVHRHSTIAPFETNPFGR